jgi:hypothetical protein
MEATSEGGTPPEKRSLGWSEPALREPLAGAPQCGQRGGSDHDGVPSRCVSPGRQAEAAISVAKLR